MGSIIGIPTTRVSDLFVRQRLMNQVQMDQLDLFRIQTQISTGHRFQVPSEDADAAARIIKLQRLLERKEQVQTNLRTNQSYLSATDTALAAISSIAAETRGSALEVLGTIVTDTQREAVAQQVQQAIQHLVDAGNQKFRGRYLFAGSNTVVRPFEMTGARVIKYLGDEGRISSYSDIDLLFDSNLNGSEVFGAISQTVLGAADLNPVLTYDTCLADLNAGKGVARGSILISGGNASSTIDVSNAETIGDVAALIRANPPAGKALNVAVSATGLVIELVGNPTDLLTIREVGGGTTAEDLGILTTAGVSVPVVGDDLHPILRLTTRIDDILGTQSCAVVRSPGADNDLIFKARTNGATRNGTKIEFRDTGAEAVTYDEALQTLTFDINCGTTTAQDIIDLLDNDPTAGALFSAGLDPTDENLGGGSGKVAVTDPLAPPTMAGGGGEVLDKSSGLQIVNGGQTYVISFADAETVEDMLNILNMADAGLLAQINENATGIDVRSRISGFDFMIGENGGTTATQLGLRTLTLNTRLEDLNHGRGVEEQEGSARVASATKQWSGANNDLIFRARRAEPAFNGFTISFEEGVPPGTESLNYDPVAKTMVFGIDRGSTTANDVIALLEQDPAAVAAFAIELDPGDGSPNDGTGLVSIGGPVITGGGETAGVDFNVTLADGTEIEIDVSDNDGSGPVAATDPVAPPETAGGSATRYAVATVESIGLDNDLVFQANHLGGSYNGVKINFQENPGAPATLVAYVPGVELTFAFDPGVSTAREIITALQADPVAAADFSATLDPTDGSAAETIGDVLTLISGKDPTKLDARLATYGNGIELVDLTEGTGPITVTRNHRSWAAIQLGLIPEGQDRQSGGVASGAAIATFDFGDADPNNDLVFTAVRAGTGMNGTQVIFNPVVGPPPVVFVHDPVGKTLTVNFDFAAPPTAQAILTALASDPLSAQFTATLAPGSDGTGTVAAAVATMTGGSQALTGDDVSPLETEGVFTALLRLQKALEADDIEQAERAIELLDREMVSINFARAGLGARQQGLDIMQTRLEDENVNLQTALSEDFDVDLVEVISEFNGRQIALEASLRSSASIFQMTLLNYL